MGNFVSKIMSFLPDVVIAIVLLIVAFIAAALVKTIVTKLLKALHVEKLFEKIGVKADSTASIITFLAKLAYFVTFLLFLPGVLDQLGMRSVSSPITNMVNSFLAFIPKLVAAGLIIAIGLFVANIVRELLIPVLKAIKVDAIQEKAGIQTSENTTFSSVIANVVYGLIVLIVIVAGLNQLGIATISAPANDIVNSIFNIIPNVLAAILIIGVGVFIARLVARLLTAVLAGVGCDSLTEKITGTASKIQLSRLIGEIVKYVLVVVFVVQGINVLNLAVLTHIGSVIIAYMPAVLGAVIILVLGIFAANTVGTVMEKKLPDAKVGALIARIAIYVVVTFLCLSQLGIAPSIVNSTFILIVAALCVAFAIAFGVGGRKFASDALDKLEKKIDEK